MNPALLERRGSLRDRMRALLDSSDGDSLTPDQASEFDRMQADLDGLNRRIDRELQVDEADRRATGTSLGDVSLDMQVQQCSLRRAIGCQIPDLRIDGGREVEISQELARRAGISPQGLIVPLAIFHQRSRPLQQRIITTTTPAGGPGANVIPTDYLAEEFIDLLRPLLVTTRLGARTLSGLQGDVEIPGVESDPAAQWIAENAALTPADPAFRQVLMTPKTVGKLTEVSRRMVLQSSPDIELLLRQIFAEAIAVAIDRAAINGAGGVEPQGLIPRLTLADATTGGLTWTGILTAIADVETDNAIVNQATTGFAMDPAVKAIAMGKALVASTDSTMIMTEPTVLAGYRAVSSNNVPDGILLFGDWSQLLIGYWDQFSVLVNPYAEVPYSKGNIQIRALASVDVAVRHIESFSGITNITS